MWTSTIEYYIFLLQEFCECGELQTIRELIESKVVDSNKVIDRSGRWYHDQHSYMVANDNRNHPMTRKTDSHNTVKRRDSEKKRQQKKEN